MFLGSRHSREAGQSWYSAMTVFPHRVLENRSKNAAHCSLQELLSHVLILYCTMTLGTVDQNGRVSQLSVQDYRMMFHDCGAHGFTCFEKSRFMNQHLCNPVMRSRMIHEPRKMPNIDNDEAFDGSSRRNSRSQWARNSTRGVTG